MSKLVKPKPRGVALITAMLVVSLATITAVAMMARKQVDFRRSENVLYHEQAYLYLLGAEDWAKQTLLRDRKNNDIDSYKDDWATILPPLPIEGGSIGGKIEDLQGRININNLASGDVNSVDYLRFKKLLELNDIPVGLVNTIADWLDADQDVRFPDGAEDVDYLYGDTPYRTGNRMMQSATELLLVKGLTYEIYEKIAPAIVALPDHTDINVNTATEEVLQTLIEEFTAADAEKLIADRLKEPFVKIEDFLQHASVKGKKVTTNGLTVSSKYFLLTAEAEIGRVEATLESIIHRVDQNTLRVIARSQGGL